MITFVVKGDDKVERWMKETQLKLKYRKYIPIMQDAGVKGVAALRDATPKDTGLTANSWSYDLVFDSVEARIIFKNSNVVKGWFNVALALQYGHGTGTGGFVEGRDYINPALDPIFREMSIDLKREVG